MSESRMMGITAFKCRRSSEIKKEFKEIENKYSSPLRHLRKYSIHHSSKEGGEKSKKGYHVPPIGSHLSRIIKLNEKQNNTKSSFKLEELRNIIEQNGITSAERNTNTNTSTKTNTKIIGSSRNENFFVTISRKGNDGNTSYETKKVELRSQVFDDDPDGKYIHKRNVKSQNNIGISGNLKQPREYSEILTGGCCSGSGMTSTSTTTTGSNTKTVLLPFASECRAKDRKLIEKKNARLIRQTYENNMNNNSNNYFRVGRLSGISPREPIIQQRKISRGKGNNYRGNIMKGKLVLNECAINRGHSIKEDGELAELYKNSFEYSKETDITLPQIKSSNGFETGRSEEWKDKIRRFKERLPDVEIYKNTRVEYMTRMAKKYPDIKPNIYLPKLLLKMGKKKAKFHAPITSSQFNSGGGQMSLGKLPNKNDIHMRSESQLE